MIAMLALMAVGLMAASRTMTIDEQSHGRTVKAPVQTTLVVQLHAQLGTGYSWRVQSAPSTLKLLDSVTEPQAGTQQVGGGERQRFLFRVAKKGLRRLRLEYVRPWEKNVKPAKTFEVTIDSR